MRVSRHSSRMRRTAASLALLLCVCATATVAPPRAAAAATDPSQMDVEAVYLWNFAKFLRWPGPPENGTRDICVAGRRSSLEALKKMVNGEQLNGIPVVARAVEKNADLFGCDILFLDSQARAPESLLAAVAGKPILTVSDSSSFLERGGMVQFLVVNSRVRFSVNMTPVVKSRLGLSSELLKVAVKVTGAAGEGGL